MISHFVKINSTLREGGPFREVSLNDDIIYQYQLKNVTCRIMIYEFIPKYFWLLSSSCSKKFPGVHCSLNSISDGLFRFFKKILNKDFYCTTFTV